MDSLRNLSTSLPRTTPPAASPHELLSAFKAAALSVTNLYKTAASDQARSRAAGYQDALDDLLTFLDRENFGLGVDGEGWRIRQWATERFNGAGHSDEEDERDEAQQQESRHESPEVQRKQEQQPQQEQPSAEPPAHEDEEVRVEAVPTPQHHNSDVFTFRSSLPYPNHMHDRDMEMEPGNLSTESQNTTSTATVNLLPRQRNHRHGHRHASGTNRTASLNNTNSGLGAGSKRKVPDFFDLSNFGGFGGGFGGNSGPKDPDRFGGGGKRGRHV
ncbi:hypothetical protein BDV97DRAFT_366064 [Delphinella strobiligena]|nr:hypothetical protein BDV97DRAFT_366064 [Delphinella strobiligena]